MMPETRPTESVQINVDPAAVKVVEESRHRETMKAVRIMAAGAVISWGMIAYSIGRDEGTPWTFPVIVAGLLVALYGRRVLDRGRRTMWDQLKATTHHAE